MSTVIWAANGASVTMGHPMRLMSLWALLEQSIPEAERSSMSLLLSVPYLNEEELSDEQVVTLLDEADRARQYTKNEEIIDRLDALSGLKAGNGDQSV